MLVFDRVRRGRRSGPGGSLRDQLRRKLRGRPAIGESITVVIPCYNEARFLADALQSLQAQTYTRWECVVVDDASIDDSPRIAAEFAATDPRISLVRHRVNGGLSAARNTGIRLAKTPWICFLDADDFLLAESLADRASALAVADDDDDVAGVFTGVITVEEDASPRQFPARLSDELEPFVDWLTCGGECPFPAHAPLVKVDVVRRAGGFDESMRAGAEDWDLWRRLMRNGFLFRSAGSRTAAYRMKSGSMVGKTPAVHLELGRALIASASLPMSSDDVMPGAPLVLQAPLDSYASGLHIARRTLRYAGMLASESEEALIEAVHAVDPVVWRLLARHDDVDRLISDGVRRAESVSAGPLDAAFDSDAMTSRIRAAVESCTLPCKTRSYGDGRTLIVPSSAADVERLSADADPDATWVCVDREDGDQGTGPAMAAAGLAPVSLNQLAFANERASDRVLTGRWPGAAAASLRDGETHASIEDPHRIEEYARLSVDAAGISALRNRHLGERCFIVGNGPSLAETDLTLLRNEVTFGVNGIFYAQDRMGFEPTYYVVEDTSVMNENLDEIRAYPAGQKLFPSIYRSLYDRDDALFFNMNRGYYEPQSPNCGTPRFSVDAAQRLFTGQSVTYINLQLAYFMGFATVVLIGMDFSYVIPDNVNREGDVLTSNGPDPNHFHPDYFGKGKTWKDPRLDRVLESYKLAKDMFEADGRRVVNATIGGALELFPREDYHALFTGVAPDQQPGDEGGDRS